jgi:hypothetical protein
LKQTNKRKKYRSKPAGDFKNGGASLKPKPPKKTVFDCDLALCSM